MKSIATWNKSKKKKRKVRSQMWDLYPIRRKDRLSLKVFGACEIHGHGLEVRGESDVRGLRNIMWSLLYAGQAVCLSVPFWYKTLWWEKQPRRQLNSIEQGKSIDYLEPRSDTITKRLTCDEPASQLSLQNQTTVTESCIVLLSMKSMRKGTKEYSKKRRAGFGRWKKHSRVLTEKNQIW